MEIIKKIELDEKTQLLVDYKFVEVMFFKLWKDNLITKKEYDKLIENTKKELEEKLKVLE